ncbi:MAG: hypothetical protein R3B96_16785 [Pirellulaceae bacterium]
MCDCEAGLDRYVGPGTSEPDATPDGRLGAVVQFHVPRFRKDRREALERATLQRIAMNVLTCPTTRCFNLIDSEDYFRIGRKIAYFGDRHERLVDAFGRKMWWIPTMGGSFQIDRRFGFRDGIMGGNLWFLGSSEEAAVEAADRAAQAVLDAPGTITTFPGGVAASASKAGSAYSFLFASTYGEWCPELKDKLGDSSLVPDGVRSIMEIIINGRDLATVTQATDLAIAACRETPGLLKISAGNYNGRLGKSFIYLDPSKRPAPAT